MYDSLTADTAETSLAELVCLVRITLICTILMDYYGLGIAFAQSIAHLKEVPNGCVRAFETRSPES
jgi:hypothetical protein